MKQLAATYSISGAAVTLTGVNVPLSQILLVSDATTGTVLYSMAGPAASSYTQAANSVITLASTPGSIDKLTVYYDDGVAPANANTSALALESGGNLAALAAATGTTGDAYATYWGTTSSIISLLKGILYKVVNGVTATVGTVSAVTYVASVNSVSSLPLPSGAAVSANQISGGPQLGSGVITATTQRVTLASDGPEVTNSTAIKNSTATIATNTTGVATAANQATQITSLATIATNTAKVAGFSLPTYDYISCSYTSSNMTGVVYKTGGSSGTTVATLTLGYDGSNNLTSVTKS